MAAPTNRPTSVFISYSRADSTTIDRLEAELIGYGFVTWVDRNHIEGGDQWAAQIEHAIEACDVVVVGLSPDAIASSWVTSELFYAQQLSKPIIPVVIRPVERIPLLLAAIQYIDMQRDESQGLQQLRLRLLRLGEQSTAASATPPSPSPGSISQRIAPTAQEHVSDPAAQLVALPQPAPVDALNDLFVQAIKAKANNDLDQAEALLRQVVERDASFGKGVAAQQLEEVQRLLLPTQLERLRKQAQEAETQGAWGEAVGAWQAFLERAPDDTDAQVALKLDEQNRDAAWLYANARTLAQQQDWPAFLQMWQLLQERAPNYGDPDSIAFLALDPGTLIAVFQGHTKEVLSVAWSPDGQRLATASNDMTACVWDIASGNQLVTLYEHAGRVLSVAWSPDGQRLVTSDQTVREWDAASGTRLMIVRDYPSIVWSVAWSPDGQRLAMASNNKNVSVRSATNGRYLLEFVGHADQVRSVAWSPDGQRLATASNDMTACVWDIASGGLLSICRGHSNAVHCVVWSPDGQRLATASVDGTACVWDATTGEVFLTYQGHRNIVWSVAWSPDGRRLATSSSDQTAQVWDAVTGRLLLTCRGHTGAVGTVAWSPDGQRLATGSDDRTARIWRV